MTGGARSSWLHHHPPRAFSPPHICPAAPTAVHPGGGGGPELGRRRWRRDTRRGDALVVRAGPPSTSTLVFAFVFPLSMILGTIFASVRIADQLDQRYLEELARDGAKMQEKGAEGRTEGDPRSEEDEATPLRDGRLIPAGAATSTATIEEASSAPRSRNRPKRRA
ncbi:unnamed protein product [Spirodela intermedia]|uniref:Uncharacterized protein n=1 Tax=Spirodela intermedia TaxID=51605 RepID=A0A7I8J034_SPIIN|nr:unnamed protein product [Spirodela intermedia]CAA6663575.1 unnamed protein product [Spirodela intermedia]